MLGLTRFGRCPAEIPIRSTRWVRATPCRTPAETGSAGGAMTLLWGIVILVVANSAAISAMLLVRRGLRRGATSRTAIARRGCSACSPVVSPSSPASSSSSPSPPTTSRAAAGRPRRSPWFGGPRPPSSPGGGQNRLSGELVCYGRSVVHREWPQMEDGKGGGTINPWTFALSRSLEVANPTTAGEQAAYFEVARSDLGPGTGPARRLHGAEGIIPGSIWLVLS